MNKDNCPLEKWTKGKEQWAAIGIRLTLGIIFVVYGAQKLFGVWGGPGLDGFSGMLSGLGIPAAGIMAIVVAIVELAGGLALIAGFGTRYAATLLGVIMLVAIVTVTGKNGLAGPGGYAINLAILGGCWSLLFSGAQEWSFDSKCCK
jgi:putative oxidoreductase